MTYPQFITYTYMYKKKWMKTRVDHPLLFCKIEQMVAFTLSGIIADYWGIPSYIVDNKSFLSK